MPPPTHRSRHDAADALAQVGPLVTRWMERLLAAHDPPLTLAHYLTLQAVGAGEAVGVELARSAGVSPSAVAQLLGSLEEAGLVTRGRAPGDRRRQTIVRSPAGERAYASAEQALRRGLGVILADLPPHESHELARALGRVHALLTGSPPPRRPPRPHPPPPRR
jgi:DNA-binding MarR family transcriptional regulator